METLMKETLSDKKCLVEKFLKGDLCRLSGHSFVNIFLWKDFFQFQFEEIDGNLCVWAENEAGKFLYLPPLGTPMSPRAVEKCFEIMRKDNSGRPVTRIENVDESQLNSFNPQKFAVTKKSDEYVYLREGIAGLTGNAYKSKRSEYNQFKKNYRFEILLFESARQTGCMDLYERWADQRLAGGREDIYRYMIEDNRTVHRMAMEHYKLLGLIGRVIVVDSEIRAYTFGYRLSDDTFCVLFEITDFNFKGLPAFIFCEFCRDPGTAEFKFINAMDDFGMENIRKTKLSFRPHKIIPVYTVTER